MPCHASSSSTRSRLTLKSATGSAPRNRSSCPKLRSYWALLGSTFPHILALITFSMILSCFWSFFHPPSTCWQMSRSFWAAWGSLWLWLLRQQVFQYRSLHSKHHLKHWLLRPISMRSALKVTKDLQGLTSDKVWLWQLIDILRTSYPQFFDDHASSDELLKRRRSFARARALVDMPPCGRPPLG